MNRPLTVNWLFFHIVKKYPLCSGGEWTNYYDYIIAYNAILLSKCNAFGFWFWLVSRNNGVEKSGDTLRGAVLVLRHVYANKVVLNFKTIPKPISIPSYDLFAPYRAWLLLPWDCNELRISTLKWHVFIRAERDI